MKIILVSVYLQTVLIVLKLNGGLIFPWLGILSPIIALFLVMLWALLFSFYREIWKGGRK